MLSTFLWKQGQGGGGGSSGCRFYCSLDLPIDSYCFSVFERCKLLLFYQQSDCIINDVAVIYLVKCLRFPYDVAFLFKHSINLPLGFATLDSPFAVVTWVVTQRSPH